MKIFLGIVLLLILPLLISCSNCKETSKQETTDDQKNPTSVGPNLSIVTVKVNEVLFKSETDYQIKATVLEVESSPQYQSIAVKNKDYLLIPNFRYDNETLIENDINDSLKKLSKLSSNKTFKAEISFEYQKGWYIQKILSVE